jgi:hypothetical protein
MHTAEPLVFKLSPIEGATAIAKLVKYKLPGIDQILAEFIQAESENITF